MTVYVWFVRGDEHAALCRTSMESVRRVDSDARCFVMTDEHERSWEVDCGVYSIQQGLPIMLANLEAQVNALFIAGLWDEPVAFLDTDILLLQKLPCLADLTVTWRDHVGIKDEEKVEGVAAQMPYNYGVMVAKPEGAAVEAFIFMRERIRRMHSRFQQWYGNQLALAELCGPRPEQGTQTVVRHIPWMLTSHGRPLSVAKIPADTFNYTPQKAGEDVTGKVALHFKGRSRDLMAGYAQSLGFAMQVAA